MDKGKGKKTGKGGINRREFMKKGAMAVGAAMTSSLVVPKLVKPAKAAGRDYILIGRPNPATGPIASFGEGTPWVDDRVLAEINKDGGIIMGANRKYLITALNASGMSDIYSFYWYLREL